MELLEQLHRNKKEIDIDLKLKEKIKIESIVTYLIENLNISTDDKKELRSLIDNLIKSNEVSNKIISNINSNIRKINLASTEEEKNDLRKINSNLNESLDENTEILEKNEKYFRYIFKK